MQVAGLSDIGLVRSQNQDSYAIVYNKNDHMLAMVCDGIGGANSGDIASLMAVREMSYQFAKTSLFDDLKSVSKWFDQQLKDINDLIFSKTVSKKEYKGMGTTFVGFYHSPLGSLIINVGDSRGYLLKNGQLVQITSDHSLVSELIEKGELSIEEGLVHPQRNILTNALGVVGNLRVDCFEVKDFQSILLCTDGLSSYVEEEVIIEILEKNQPLNVRCQSLISAANEAGGFDNVTVIIGDSND